MRAKLIKSQVSNKEKDQDLIANLSITETGNGYLATFVSEDPAITYQLENSKITIAGDLMKIKGEWKGENKDAFLPASITLIPLGE